MSSATNQFRKTKIIATLGPACNNVETMVKMIEAGMNCARFNFSHGDFAEHKSRYDMLHKAMEITGKRVALLLDTKGPEIRTGMVEGEGKIELHKNQPILLSGLTPYTTNEVISISYPDIHKEIKVSNQLKIADGSIVVEVTKIEGERVECVVIEGGKLSSKKNVNIPETQINLPNISEKDIADIKFAIEHDYDYIAASFVRNAQTILDIRNILTQNKKNDNNISIIAKIENREGLNNLNSIIQVVDGIMVARGDLAEQIPAEEVPIAQKHIILNCIDNKKIAITATQMLQSMEESLTPTRAELTDISNAIFDGTDAIMLSGETAQGKHPVETIATMNRVALSTERSNLFKKHSSEKFFSKEKEALLFKEASRDSVIIAAQIIANKIEANTIICPSLTGNTPRLLSVLRPNQTIIATTYDPYVYSKLMLLWGTYPIMTIQCSNDQELLDISIRKTREAGFIYKNSKAITVVGLPTNKPLMLNTIQVHFEGTVLLRGRQGGGNTKTGYFYKATDMGGIKEHLSKNKDTNKLYIYNIDNFTYEDTYILKDISALIVNKMISIPIEDILAQYPHITLIANMSAPYNTKITQSIIDNTEIVISGTEKQIYEA